VRKSKAGVKASQRLQRDRGSEGTDATAIDRMAAEDGVPFVSADEGWQDCDPRSSCGARERRAKRRMKPESLCQMRACYNTDRENGVKRGDSDDGFVIAQHGGYSSHCAP